MRARVGPGRSMRGNRTETTGVGPAMRRLRLPAALLAIACALAACGASGGDDGASSSTTTSPGRGDPSLPADQVVWQAFTGGGFVGQEVAEQQVPEITIYGDGRAFVVADEDNPNFGTPAAFETGMVSSHDLSAFMYQAGSSGLFSKKPADFGSPGVTDMPSTSATVQTTGPPLTATAYALDTQFEDGLTSAQKEARNKLRRLIARSHRIVHDPKPWTPDRVRAKVLMSTGVPAPASGEPWPGPPISEFPTPTDQIPDPCLVIDGPMAKTVYDAARDNESSAWTADGKVHSIVVTPLLPGQEGCPEM